MKPLLHKGFRVAGVARISAIGMLMTACRLAAMAQMPADTVTPVSMTFVRQAMERNFYNHSKEVASINMNGTDLFLRDAANIVVMGDGDKPEMRQHEATLVVGGKPGEATETTLRVGAFHPYLCYEACFEQVDSGEQVGIDFMNNSGKGETVRTMYGDGVVKSYKVENGRLTLLAEKETGTVGKVGLRVQYTGARFHVFVIRNAGCAELLYSVDHDMRAASTCVSHSFGVRMELPRQAGVVLTAARSMLTCGTGQADPQVVQTTDGQPLVKDGRLYVCMTTRGFERIIDSYQGVYSIDTDSYDIRLEGALFFGKGDGLMYGFHATKVVYDKQSGKYLVMTTTHEDTHTLAWAETNADILHGMHYLECRELDFPHNYTHGHGFNTEDPDFLFDDGAKRWRLAYCALRNGSYATYLCESENWNGPYRQLAESKQDNNTGIRITTVGGKRYVMSGGTGTTYYIYNYPTLEYLGTFSQQFANGGFRGWPTIVPLRYGNYERYLWLTFDRGAQTGRYSYGTLYFYLADKMWRIEK